MKDTLKAILKSKKVWVFLITILVVILNRTLDLGLTGEDLAYITGGGIFTNVGIGLADFGKEAKKVEKSAALSEDVAGAMVEGDLR